MTKMPEYMTLDDARIYAKTLGCTHEIEWTIPDVKNGANIKMCHYFGRLMKSGMFYEMFHLGLLYNSPYRPTRDFRALNNGVGRIWDSSMVPGEWSTMRPLGKGKQNA